MTIAQYKTIKVPVTTYETEARFVFEFTNDEAVFLDDVLASVGGDPEESRRTIAVDIRKAMFLVGVQGSNTRPYSKEADDHTGLIYFQPLYTTKKD